MFLDKHCTPIQHFQQPNTALCWYLALTVSNSDYAYEMSCWKRGGYVLFALT